MFFPGYSTGSIIKQQKDRQEYIDDFYSSHSPSVGMINDAANNGGFKAASAQLKREQWSNQRAHSLPDVLSSRDESQPLRGNLVRNNNNGSTRKNYHVRFDLIAEDSKNYHRPSLPNHVAGLRRAQSARRAVTTRSTDNLLC